MDEGRLSAPINCNRSFRCLGLTEQNSRTGRSLRWLQDRVPSAVLSVVPSGAGLRSLPEGGGRGGSLWGSGEWWMLLSAQSMAVGPRPPLSPAPSVPHARVWDGNPQPDARVTL